MPNILMIFSRKVQSFCECSQRAWQVEVESSIWGVKQRESLSEKGNHKLYGIV